MDQEKRGPNEAADESVNGVAADESAADSQEAERAEFGEDRVAKLEAEVEALKKEKKELHEKSLRLVSDMENLRRRTERDKAEFSKYAISEFARDILGVGDNLRRAIESVPKESIEADSVLRSVVEGVEVTEKEFLKTLDKYQVSRFDPKGEPFNPHKHDAMTRIEVPNVPADTVVQVIHAGYMIGERVLRPAAVIVSKESTGTEKASDETPSEQDEIEEQVPPGAMKVPEGVESVSAEVNRMNDTPPPRNARVDVQQNVLGRDFQKDRRRQNAGTAENDDRVAQFRRPRSPAGDQSYSEVRPSSSSGGGGSSTKPSALHKPVISRKD